MSKTHIFWDAENIQIHSHYLGAKLKFLHLVPGNIDWQRQIWNQSKKIAVYCECNEKRANKDDNEVFNCIVIDSKNSQAADIRIVKLCKELNEHDILFIVTNDNDLIQECINVCKAKNITNLRTLPPSRNFNLKQNLKFKVIQFSKFIKNKGKKNDRYRSSKQRKKKREFEYVENYS